MSDRTENKKTNRERSNAPGARHDAPEEYTSYREVEPEKAGVKEAEALREAELQPGGPEPEPGENEKVEKDAKGRDH